MATSVRGHRPRIALVVPSLDQGGGVPAVARFVKDAIVESGEFDLKVVSLATSGGDACSVSLKRPGSWLRGVVQRTAHWDGVPYTHVGAWAADLEFQRYRPRRALDGLLEGCDVVHVVAGTSAWGLAALLTGKPLVVQVASRAIVERRRRERVARGPLAWWRFAMTRITDRLDDRVLRDADAVLVMNPWMHAYASDLRKERAGGVRYGVPGVDTGLFAPLAGRTSRNAEDAYILSVGRFSDPRKHIGLLLEAYYALVQSVPIPPSLRLAGATDPGPAFWARVRELGLARHVSFHERPSQKQLVDYYQRALCFALPSDEEGFGMVLIEAMSCGVPVVSTRCGGPDGIVTEGVDGFLVPIGDVKAMTDRMRRLTQDLAQNAEMGHAARATAINRYSREVAARACLETYRRLAAER
jgi:glycosyltransferase involved in cell wall biosynthesis